MANEGEVFPCYTLCRTTGRERFAAGETDLAMATFFIEQFGCRATQADAAAIERQLRERGYAASPDAHSADVVVVNTCTVTAAADVQARRAIHTIHPENPGARSVVTGCYPHRAPEHLPPPPAVPVVVG